MDLPESYGTKRQLDHYELNFSVSYIERAGRIADAIEKYWVGHTQSNIGIPYIKLVNGLVSCEGHFYARQDIAWIRLKEIEIVAAFVDIGKDKNGTYLSYNGSVFVTDALKKVFHRVAEAALARHPEWVDHQRRFFTEQPWCDLNGLTPAQAVENLRRDGW